MKNVQIWLNLKSELKDSFDLQSGDFIIHNTSEFWAKYTMDLNGEFLKRQFITKHHL